MNRLPRRVRAVLIHLLASATLAAIAASVIFLVWYPYPYRDVSGGASLFVLIMGVDLVMGPALTAVVASATKPLAELRRDISIIAVLQLAALAYGVYTLALARPVYMVFEVDRMRVVSAADIDPALLAEASPEFRNLPWSGPKLIATRKPTGADEQFRAMSLGLGGVDLSMLPRQWYRYEDARAEVLARARPVAPLEARYPQVAAEIRKVAEKSGVGIENLRFLPLMSRQASWVALLTAQDARVVGYLPVDGFF